MTDERVVASRRCWRCGVDPMARRHVLSCPTYGEIYRLSFDAEGKRLEDLLAEATRRAWRSYVAAGFRFQRAAARTSA